MSNGGDHVNIHLMATAWDNDATWKSFGSGIQANDLEALSTVDVTSSSYVSSGWTDFDVTTSLAAWPADPSSNFGWAMLPTDTNSVQFYTSDNVSYWVPRLSVDYPAPAGDVHSDAPDGSATPLDLSSGIRHIRSRWRQRRLPVHCHAVDDHHDRPRLDGRQQHR
ncbi:MAG: hypothetical protein ACKVHE_11235 [Planctomycetales bacterium]